MRVLGRGFCFGGEICSNCPSGRKATFGGKSESASCNVHQSFLRVLQSLKCPSNLHVWQKRETPKIDSSFPYSEINQPTHTHTAAFWIRGLVVLDEASLYFPRKNSIKTHLGSTSEGTDAFPLAPHPHATPTPPPPRQTARPAFLTRATTEPLMGAPTPGCGGSSSPDAGRAKDPQGTKRDLGQRMGSANQKEKRLGCLVEWFSYFPMEPNKNKGSTNMTGVLFEAILLL